ncbi:hypothetical protein ASE04_27275 [Rhizobium sp. Root708]|nr:hypothetical protein ASE04_27275 [Rhizobium sp. Root708]
MSSYRKILSLSLGLIAATASFSVAWSADQPTNGSTLVYLEQQSHANLYPPAGGFYPNGGVLNLSNRYYCAAH